MGGVVGRGGHPWELLNRLCRFGVFVPSRACWTHEDTRLTTETPGRMALFIALI